MKYFFKYILIIISVISFVRCSDFLKESSDDLLIPKRVEDFTPLLYGEGYPKNFDRNADWIKLMTDDVEFGYLKNEDPETPIEFDLMYGGEGRYPYIWDYNIGEYVIDNFWSGCYQNILGCNTIIEALPDMLYEIDEKPKFSYLAAQAYALRAYHYFCLINTYALPYSEANKSELGVVIRTSPEIEEKPIPRSTIEEVWNLINGDIEKSIEHMSVSTPSTNLHLLSPASMWLLASRIALFQEKWDEVILTGENFLLENSYLFDLNSVSKDDMGKNSSNDFHILNTKNNNEIVFTFGTNTIAYGYLSRPPTLWGLGFMVSKEADNSLMKSYEENDLRKDAYFMKDYIQKGSWGDPDKQIYTHSYPIKYLRGGENYRENWRTVEVYLNLAEAHARKESAISSKAIDLLNTIRSKRIKKDQFVALKGSDFTNKEELVQFVWDERRRELCFEEIMRFWDLRRTGMPEIEHRWYVDKENYESYTLEQGGNNYVLQIPASETRYNDLIVPNPRDVISKQ